MTQQAISDHIKQGTENYVITLLILVTSTTKRSEIAEYGRGGKSNNQNQQVQTLQPEVAYVEEGKIMDTLLSAKNGSFSNSSRKKKQLHAKMCTSVCNSSN